MPTPSRRLWPCNLERLQLQVDRLLPLHGRVVPVAELYRAAGRTPGR
jgi:hypothetical protein